MSEIALRAEQVSKRYRIGLRVDHHDSFRGAVIRALAAPFRNLSRLKRLSTFEKENGPDVLWALQDVSFEVKRGEVLGVVGRNGAGKSTLLKILSRITLPTRGQVFVTGRVGSLLEVGTGFHPELTGRDNIFLNGAILGMSRAEIRSKFDEIVDFAGVERFIDTPVKRYSSGMYLRLAFAVAAHFQPDILIVDEVLAVGDAEFQRKCLGKMEEVGKDGRTVIFVSHNMNAIERLCHSAILLQNGRVVREGSPHSVVSAYLASTSSPVTDRFWPDPETAPGNDRIRIRRATIRPSNGRPSDLISVNTDVEIEIEFWNLVPGTCVKPVLFLSTLDGLPVFATEPAACSPWRLQPRPKGLFRSTCRIPGGLLNDLQYRMAIYFMEGETNLAYRHWEVLRFPVRNVVEAGVGRHGEWYGVVRPRLDWTEEQVGHVVAADDGEEMATESDHAPADRRTERESFRVQA